MEFLATAKRTPDAKRRITFPVEWCREATEFFLVREEYLKLYSHEAWKQTMNLMESDEKKIAWSQKSLQVRLDGQKRLMLPKGCNWRHVDLIGMVDYVIIMESAE